MTIALLTARGGSIRLPRKNIKLFNGLPLLAWSIIQAKCSRLIDDVFLTTDDEEIADIGEKYGAKIIFRPVYDNNVSAGYVLKLAVEELEKNDVEIDNVVYMLPTSPLKKPQDLDNLIASFHDINKYQKIDDLGVYSPDKECFVYRNVDAMMDHYGTAYKLIPVIADKKWNYSKSVGGWGIADKNYLMDFWEKQGMYDNVIDDKLKDIDTNKGIYGYAIEPWQCFETDYEEQFRLCEIIMEEFILKGKGINAYINYAKSFGKDIYHEKQLSLFEKYAGNSKQLIKE
jgi:CMP-2-keto-3-deoxyoctulosonic acid synthetase